MVPDGIVEFVFFIDQLAPGWQNSFLILHQEDLHFARLIVEDLLIDQGLRHA